MKGVLSFKVTKKKIWRKEKASNTIKSSLFYIKPVSCLLPFSEWVLALTKEMGSRDHRKFLQII
jgi:hypothetical protein